MLELSYSNQEEQAVAIKDKLTSLSLAFREAKSDVEIITLVDGNNTITGVKAILGHLEKLEGELHQWYYCDC